MQQWERTTGDKNRIGEMGIGINSEVHLPSGYMVTDEKIMGTIHLGLGDNQLLLLFPSSWGGVMIDSAIIAFPAGCAGQPTSTISRK